ncbi:MAG: SDR family NAD(P)-dependent oxidoreductase [Bacteroidales bacterium]|nr:SDR family NAD(P)-dependent oxidoreductase [Candidatus Sodaliphilus aphodohippi]
MPKRAIIMGATSGIGLETARLLASRGWQVAIAGRRGHLLDQIKSSTPGIVATSVIDINEDDAPDKLNALITTMGGIDLYLHCSGIGYRNEQLDADKEVATVTTNCQGFTRMIDTAFNYFASAGSGHIPAVSSIAGTKPLGSAPAYSAAKRFQNHYLASLRQLVRKRGLNIALTDIRPGFVATDLIKDADYPMQMTAPDVARAIVRAVEHKRHVVTIDWRYRFLVPLWRITPNWLLRF